MALDIFSDNSGWTFSPRISFSCDLSQTDRLGGHPGELDSTLLSGSPSPDFHFCVPQQNNSSPADQLFSNGKILTLASSTSSVSPDPAPSSATIQECLEETRNDGAKQQSPATSMPRPSFWKFSRSSSLNCRSITKSGLMSTLNKLTRSKSLGSHTKQASKKPPPPPPPPPPPSAKVMGRKPQAMKRESSNNGVRINPVFNVPPPYISGGRSSLFSLGYFLCRKEKNRKTF